MEKRSVIKTAGIGALLMLPSMLHAANAPVIRPNVLFIAVDDLNHWVGYLGRNK